MNKRIGIGAMTVLACLTVGQLGAQQPAGPAIDVETAGPQVGAMVPDFNLPDQHPHRRCARHGDVAVLRSGISGTRHDLERNERVKQ